MMPDPVAELVITAQERYDANGLTYHNWDHIVSMLAMLLDWNPPLSEEDRTILEMAVLFHDVVYDPQRSDNEALSADFAAQELGKTRYASLADAVSQAIMVTASHEPETACEMLLVDLDLAILASPRYDEYVAAIRQEYGFASDEAFSAGRSAFLEKFLQREKLFWTEFGVPMEPQARENMQKELECLRS